MVSSRRRENDWDAWLVSSNGCVGQEQPLTGALKGDLIVVGVFLRYGSCAAHSQVPGIDVSKIHLLVSNGPRHVSGGT
jgi:hypothetical protein